MYDLAEGGGPRRHHEHLHFVPQWTASHRRHCHPRFFQTYPSYEPVGWYTVDGHDVGVGNDDYVSGPDVSHGTASEHNGDVIVIDLSGGSSVTSSGSSVASHEKRRKRHTESETKDGNTDSSGTKQPITITTKNTKTPTFALVAVSPGGGAVAIPIDRTVATSVDIAPSTKSTTSIVSPTDNVKESADSKQDSNKNVTKVAPSEDSNVKTQTGTVAAGTGTGTSKTFQVRTPVHHNETPTFATMSFDVSGFTMDQLEVRVVEPGDDEPKGVSDPGSSNSNRKNVVMLTVSGKRQNSIGDEFVIDRKFVLRRDQLATSDVDKLQIEAQMTKSDENDGCAILTIRVPKKT
jgi:hypothetical protein